MADREARRRIANLRGVQEGLTDTLAALTDTLAALTTNASMVSETLADHGTRLATLTTDLAAEKARVHREVLQQIAAMPTVQRNPDGDDQAAATMKLLAQEALDWPASAAPPTLKGEDDA